MKIMHIDMSGKFFHKETIGIAYTFTKDKSKHKGIALKGRTINHIIQENNYLENDYGKLYAVCIYFIIKDILEEINKLIICNDEAFDVIKKSLKILFKERLNSINLTSIADYRNELGKNIKSLAHGRANSYRKRGLRRHRWNRGTKLNVVKINKKNINKLLKIINEEFNNSEE